MPVNTKTVSSALQPRLRETTRVSLSGPAAMSACCTRRTRRMPQSRTGSIRKAAQRPSNSHLQQLCSCSTRTTSTNDRAALQRPRQQPRTAAPPQLGADQPRSLVLACQCAKEEFGNTRDAPKRANKSGGACRKLPAYGERPSACNATPSCSEQRVKGAHSRLPEQHWRTDIASSVFNAVVTSVRPGSGVSHAQRVDAQASVRTAECTGSAVSCEGHARCKRSNCKRDLHGHCAPRARGGKDTTSLAGTSDSSATSLKASASQLSSSLEVQ